MNEAATQIKVLPDPAQGNDGKGKVDPVATNANPQGIAGRARKVIDRFGIKFIKKAGRPRNDGLPGKGDEIISEVYTSGPVPGTMVGASLDPGLDADFSQECLEAVHEAALDLGNSKLRRLALRATTDEKFPKGDKAYADQLIVDTSPSEKEISRIAKLENILLKKYKIDLRHFPEFALGFCVLGIGTRYMTAIGELKDKLPPEEPELKVVERE